MYLKYNLQAIPVCLAALVLWAVIGGWYIAIVPLNMAGTDNIGIVLSIFGICLFLSDRLAWLWFKTNAKFLFLSIWMWGLLLMAWGLFEWLHALSRRYAIIFIIHWSILMAVIAGASFLIRRQRKAAN